MHFINRQREDQALSIQPKQLSQSSTLISCKLVSCFSGSQMQLNFRYKMLSENVDIFMF